MVACWGKISNYLEAQIKAEYGALKEKYFPDRTSRIST